MAREDGDISPDYMDVNHIPNKKVIHVYIIHVYVHVHVLAVLLKHGSVLIRLQVILLDMYYV